MIEWMRYRGLDMYAWLVWIYLLMFLPVVLIASLEQMDVFGFSRFEYCSPLEEVPNGIFVCYER